MGEANTLTILVDMDNVLADFESHFLRKFRERYPDDPFVTTTKRNTFYLSPQYETLEGLENPIVSTKIKILTSIYTDAMKYRL